ncbi:MAG TPA: NADH:flavin oxidoreductase [Bryobacteraceae bacterium]|nr:NADH:flavin oxidoreductase [Bryobacteraceae bacterium]
MAGSPPTHYRRVAALKSADEFGAHLAQLGLTLGFNRELSTGDSSPLNQPYDLEDFRIGNRFCILPMEGWDGTEDGKPSDLTVRRWRNFGESGAKLIWGGEAVAVRHDGRANPNQLLSADHTASSLAELRRVLVSAHEERYGGSRDLLVGLQLTHSGRFSRPNRKDRLEPCILYHHPLLDRKFGIAPDYPCLTDAQIEQIIEDFVKAAVRAQSAGFAFVDIKHCHGYLGHEFLSARTRPGKYGGSFENRTRFLREAVEGIRRDAPGLLIGVRLSAFDLIPFRMGIDRRGEPESFAGPYDYAFGADAANPREIDLTETYQFLDLLDRLGIRLLCISAGSPYYNPHIQRPALFPPTDGYEPPEDPLAGVSRLIQATSRIKSRYPQLTIVGTGYSYLQEWLPNVAQHYVRTGQVDLVGLGRMVLAYPDFVHDVLRGAPLDSKRLCRTFSDCTTGPRNGLVSGCFPLDPFYRTHPHAELVKIAKQKFKAGS